MPEIYQKNHTQILKNALTKEPEMINNKERFIFGRHKSGYIFPVTIHLKAMKNIKGHMQFIAIFKTDKK